MFSRWVFIEKGTLSKALYSVYDGILVFGRVWEDHTLCGCDCLSLKLPYYRSNSGLKLRFESVFNRTNQPTPIAVTRITL